MLTLKNNIYLDGNFQVLAIEAYLITIYIYLQELQKMLQGLPASTVRNTKQFSEVTNPKTTQKYMKA